MRCEYCGTEVGNETELEVEHRGCRLKAAFPAAYTEKGKGLLTFDMQKVSVELLYLCKDCGIRWLSEKFPIKCPECRGRNIIKSPQGKG